MSGMIERLSSFFVRTLREDPVDAEVASHRLLVRAGYIRRQAPGVFAWLPLGLRVRRRVEAIVREEMRRAGSQEVFFPALLPADLYRETNRLEDFGDGIFRLEDRKGAEYVLAPTHEEAFTLAVKDLYSSYKDLPLSIYQIQDKYRDEARPRAGLLRGREFSMKDAYSFDVDDAGLERSYQAQRDAYERIFTRLGLDYVIAAADAGAMGGSKSEEFLHPTPVGEDTFFVAPSGLAGNVEAYVSTPPSPVEPTATPATAFPSPATPTIATLVDHLNREIPHPDGREWTAADTLKNVVVALTHPDGTRELVAVGVPGDREADPKRLETALQPAEVEPATEEDFAKHPGLVKGYIGPWSAQGQVLGEKASSGIRFLLDASIGEGTAWVTGANVHEQHAHSVVVGRDFTPDGRIEAAEVRAGDPAPDGSGPIRTERGTEIGHVFQLGRKYAEALGLKVLDENGKLVTVTMGSYGIGVTRDLALVAEQRHDEKGLMWPESIAPFDAYVIATGKGPEALEAAEKIAAELDEAGLEVLLDDRPKVSPGVKFGDAELIGIPWIVIAGRGVADGEVELWQRATGDREAVKIADAAAELRRRREAAMAVDAKA
ncbi:Proline--tRNA ligase [Pseudoclavibacter triregionum]|nr:Proline--tRNA ligase [Pseudoclavibacter triregionum]